MSVLLASIISLCLFASCGTTPVTMKEELPAEVDINTDLNFKDYYETLDGARYILYVSYTDPVSGEEVVEKKLTSKIYSFELAAVYTFKIEQIIGDKSSF